MSAQRPVSQFFLSVALVASLALLSGGVYVATKRITDETLRVSVVKLLSQKDKPSVTAKRIRPHGGSSLSFSRVYRATFPDGSVANAFVVSVTGHSGPFSALYVSRPGVDASFAGLLGVRYPLETARYGLTDRVLQSWADRVTAVARRYGDDK